MNTQQRSGANDESTPAEQLVSSLLPYVSVHLYAEDSVFRDSPDETPLCYVIVAGSVGVYSAHNDILLTIADGPTLVGAGNQRPSSNEVYLRSLSECEIGTLPSSEALQIFDEQALWPVFAQHLMLVISKLYRTGRHLVAPTAYEVIRNQLHALMKESAEYRLSTTAEKYIRDKTLLSRSAVMKILRVLKQGGYIEMKDGVLLDIYRLPLRY